MSDNSARGVVERMLDHASHARWDQLHDVLDEEFEIVEPESLPYGGTHRGVRGYVELMKDIGRLFELEFDVKRELQLDDASVLLQMDVTFMARTTGRSQRLPVIELLQVRAGRVTRSEIYISDTAALLRTLAE
jgi:ketosteroid isomerase-like protein